MGVVGVCMIGFFFFLYKSIQVIGNYISFRRGAIPAVGTILEKVSSTPSFKKGNAGVVESTEHVFDFSVSWDNQTYVTRYVDVVKGQQDSKKEYGETIPILWNAYRKDFRDPSRVKKELTEYPLAMLVCVAIIALCCLILLP